MAQRALACLTVVAVGLGLVASALQTTALAGPMGAEHENERVVMRGVTACGVERWSLKTGTDRAASRIDTKTTVPTSFIHLRSLPAPASPSYIRGARRPRGVRPQRRRR